MALVIKIMKDEKVLQAVVPVRSSDGKGYEIVEGFFKRFYPVNFPSQVADHIRYSLPIRTDLPAEYNGARVTVVNKELKGWLNKNSTII